MTFGLSDLFLFGVDILTMAVMLAGLILTSAGLRKSTLRILAVLFAGLAIEIIAATVASFLIPYGVDLLDERKVIRGVGRCFEAGALTYFLLALGRGVSMQKTE